ncbi:MAG: hypothetical protein IKX45_07855 [Bacteroidales bacterium]|nr:hypothetical protein [Bacteroidales bacterium]
MTAILGCREESFFFPNNIPYSYIIDNLSIDNPIVIQSDSAIYVSSERLLDSLYEQDLTKSKYVYWMYTVDDFENALSSLFLNNFCVAVKDIRHNGFLYPQYNEDISLRYLYYDFLDKYKETDFGTVYKFKRVPRYFIIILTRPDCFYHSPEELDILQNDFQFYKLTLAPVFSKRDIHYFEKNNPSIKQNSINRYHYLDKHDDTIPAGSCGYI